MTSSADVNRDIPVGIPKLDSPDISYDVASYAHSLPRTIRILKEDGLTTASVEATMVEMKFKIPAGTYNLSKSVLKYTWQPAGNAPLTYAQWVYEDLLPIYRAQLSTQEGGVIMTDLQFADQYTRIVNKVETPINKLLTSDSLDVVHPCNVETKNNHRPYDQVVDNKGDPLSLPRIGNVAYLEPKYFTVGVDEKVIGPFTKSFELSAFKNTLFDLDKMVYYPEPLMLTLWFQGRSYWYFEGDTNKLAAALEASQDINMTGISLFMRQESDPIIDAECKAAVLNASPDAPFTLYTPVVTHRKMDMSKGPGSSVQIQLGTSMGTRLTKVYAIPIVTESKQYRYNSANEHIVIATDGKSYTELPVITAYQTRFNAINVQPNAVTVSNGEDYMQIRDAVKGTAILNRNVYNANWFILDDYSGITEETKSIYPPGKHNLVTGRKIQLGDTFELICDISTTIGQPTVKMYIYLIGQRVLRIAPLGKGGIGYM